VKQIWLSILSYILSILEKLAEEVLRHYWHLGNDRHHIINTDMQQAHQHLDHDHLTNFLSQRTILTIAKGRVTANTVGPQVAVTTASDISVQVDFNLTLLADLLHMHKERWSSDDSADSCWKSPD